MVRPGRVEHPKKKKKTRTVDIWLGARRVLRLTRRRQRRISAPVTPLYAHRDGRSVLRNEARGWRRLRFLCGVMLCSEHGAVLVQWRGWSA